MAKLVINSARKVINSATTILKDVTMPVTDNLVAWWDFSDDTTYTEFGDNGSSQLINFVNRPFGFHGVTLFSAPTPTLAVNDWVTISGVGSGWDGTWRIAVQVSQTFFAIDVEGANLPIVNPAPGGSTCTELHLNIKCSHGEISRNCPFYNRA